MPTSSTTRAMNKLLAKCTTKKKAAKKKGAKKPQANNSLNRKTVHGKPTVELCVGSTTITLQKAKDLLGWEEEEGVPYEKDFLLKDIHGTKVRCFNNVTNRPIYKPNLENLKQEILRGRWQLNGEPIIIGKTGLILNGQHSLLAFIASVQEWTANRDKWPLTIKEPTLDKLIVFGIDESDQVVNTMDTCKPRSLSDVIYRSEFFTDLPAKDRNKVAKMTDYAIKFIWNRTGISNAFGLRNTHSESLDFLQCHPKLIECAKHIHEENGDNKSISSVISPGYASGLLYLMGSSSSSPEKYAEQQNESVLDWSTWDQACDFFALIAGKSEEVQPIRTVLASMLEQNENVSIKERWCLLIKAWNSYITGAEIAKENIKLCYEIDKDGINRLAEQPTIGGIDCDCEIELPQAEIEERIKKARDEKIGKKRSAKTIKKKTTKKKTVKKSTDFIVGDAVTVDDATDAESWQGEITEILGRNARIKVTNGQQGAGTLLPARLSDLKRI